MSSASRRHHVLAIVGLLIVAGLSVAALAVTGVGVFAPKPDIASQRWGASVGRRLDDLSEPALARFVALLEPGAAAIARRRDPRPRQDYWGRVRGWERLRLDQIPRLGDGVPSLEDAQRINGFRPPAPLPIEPARPFVFRGPPAERERALHCLTQAVYFESAYEPLAGQQAVAQTVLNRVRHPGYPNSVCGVIYQGSARATGCQFSFACDGSLRRPLNLVIWAQAGAVARRALNGFVLKEVGVATHYHADYVAPYWAPTLIKLRQIGAHIFYRWTGPSGTRAAFTQRHSGLETVTQAVLLSADPRIQEVAPPAALAAGTLMRTGPPTLVGPDGVIEVLPPLASAGTGLEGAPGRRRTPTPEEIAKINKILEAMPEAAAAPVTIAAPPATAAPPTPTPPPPPRKPPQRPPSLLTPLG